MPVEMQGKACERTKETTIKRRQCKPIDLLRKVNSFRPRFTRKRKKKKTFTQQIKSVTKIYE